MRDAWHVRNPPHFQIRSLLLISGGSVRGALTAPRRARAAHPNRRGADDGGCSLT